MQISTGHLLVVSVLLSFAAARAGRTILQGSFSDAFGGNPNQGGGNPFAAGNNPFGGGSNPFAGGNTPFGGGNIPTGGSVPSGGANGPFGNNVPGSTGDSPAGANNPFSVFGGSGGSGGTVEDSSSTTPLSSAGEPFENVVTGELGTDPDTVFDEINSNPQILLQEAFGARAFRVNTVGNSFQVLLNTGQSITFALRERSQAGRFLIFEITSHTLEIFNIEDTVVNIRGTELSFQVTEDDGTPQIEVGASTEVQPASVREEVDTFLEGFLELLVTNFRMRFGAGICDDDDSETEGVCNNPNTNFGAADVLLLRLPLNDPAFADGVGAPSGPTDISPRLISNICGEQGTDEDDGTNRMGLTDSFVTFAQFVDHDLALAAESSQAEDEQPLFSVGNALAVEELPIPIPEDDPVFTGPNRRESLPFVRSAAAREDGQQLSPRRVRNTLTSILDLTQVYADEPIRRRALRAFEGGKLTTGSGNFLPRNGAGPDGVGVSLENAPTPDPNLYVAGDIRANENAELTSLHAIWHREHNRVADEIAAVVDIETDDDDDEGGQTADDILFQMARSVTIATYQSIVYTEWLPRVLGADSPSPDAASFNPNVDPTMSAFFTTAAYRFGHSMVNNVYTRRTAGANAPTSTVRLSEIFVNPDSITPDNIADVLRGATNHQARERDLRVVNDIRNLLFTRDGNPSMDLYSLNIQRGRDMGLPSYNAAREAFGLPRATSFAEITSDPDQQDRLSRAYPDVDMVEPFIGGLAEDSPADRLHGDLFQAAISEQFTRLRDGDRLFYRNFPFSEELTENYPRINDILNDRIKWADIIARNTDATVEELRGNRDSCFQL